MSHELLGLITGASNAEGVLQAASLPTWKVAALDLGSNSFHLALAGATPGGLAIATRFKEKVQLGRSVFSGGRVDEPAFARGIAALRRLREILDAEQPAVTLAVGTSALREAQNGALFARQAELILGVPVRVISGEEEAALVARGAAYGLSAERRRRAVLDLGGGSTEVILSTPQGNVFAQSLALGTLRLAADAGERDAQADDAGLMRERARHVLAPALVRLRQLGFDELVFSCGSARKLLELSVQLGLAEAETRTLTRAMTGHVFERLAALTSAERALLTGRDPGRCDTLLAGAGVFCAVFEGLGVEQASVAQTGLREGLIARYLEQHARSSLGRSAELS